MFVNQVLVYFDGGSKANSYCILRDCGKYLIIVLVSQNNLKNTGLLAGTIHKQLL